MFLKDIKPKIKGRSDKYSWQLYEFARRHFGRFSIPKVYYLQTQDHWDSKLQKTVRSEVPLNAEKLNTYYTFVGVNNRDGWYSANRLSTILGGTQDKYTVFAIPWLNGKTVVDITDWFWNEYQKIGRCIWDKSHRGWLMDDDKRFVYANKNSRKCQWCGQWQHREIEKDVVIKRKEVWNVV